MLRYAVCLPNFYRTASSSIETREDIHKLYKTQRECFLPQQTQARLYFVFFLLYGKKGPSH